MDHQAPLGSTKGPRSAIRIVRAPTPATNISPSEAQASAKGTPMAARARLIPELPGNPLAKTSTHPVITNDASKMCKPAQLATPNSARRNETRAPPESKEAVKPTK